MFKKNLNILRKNLGNAPPNSLKYSNANPKVKTMEEKGVWARSLAHNTFGVKRVCWNSKMGTRMSDKRVNYSYQSIQTK